MNVSSIYFSHGVGFSGTIPKAIFSKYLRYMMIMARPNLPPAGMSDPSLEEYHLYIEYQHFYCVIY